MSPLNCQEKSSPSILNEYDNDESSLMKRQRSVTIVVDNAVAVTSPEESSTKILRRNTTTTTPVGSLFMGTVKSLLRLNKCPSETPVDQIVDRS